MPVRAPCRTAAVAMMLVALSLLPSGPASAGREAEGSPVPLQVTLDCSVPAIPRLPANPALLSACGEPADASPVAPSFGEAAECTSIVPLVDDRCEVWTARYDGPVGGPDQPNSEHGGSRLVAVSPDSKTVFATGSSDSNPSTAAGWAGLDLDLAVAAYAAETGAPTWSFRLPHADQTYAQNVVSDPDGDLVYVTAHNYPDVGGCVRRPSTVALDQTTGAPVWSADESTPHQGCVGAETAVVDPAGERLFIVASAEDEQGRLEQTLIARDADTGALLWKAAAATGPVETGSAVAVSPDGTRVYAGGSIFASDRHVAWAIRGYDTTTGTRVFERIWDAPLPNSATPMNPPAGMAVGPDGSTLYVVGGVEHVGGRFFDITAVAFDTSSGQLEWMYRYDGPRDKSSFDSVWYNGPMALSADGSRLAIAGYSTHLIGVNLQLDLATVFVDTANGQGLWATRYTAENETNWVPSVALSPDGTTVYVAAPSRYAFAADAPARYTTLAYRSADGSVAWTARHSDGHSFAMGSALAPDGSRFFVTGMTATGGPQTVTGKNWDIGLAAYSTA